MHTGTKETSQFLRDFRNISTYTHAFEKYHSTIQKHIFFRH